MRALCALLLVACATRAAAQSPDAPPDAARAPRVAAAGELTATYGSHDPGFFNYATYAYDPLRNVRLVLDASLRPARAVELLAQVRTDGLSEARVAALFLRVRPWAARGVDVQVGRVPTAFGLFGRNGYGGDMPLVGRPLAYSYLLSLRRDAVPDAATDLLRMRGRGWLSSFPRGNTTPDRGLPLVNADTWDAGVQLHLGSARLDWTGAVTAGSLGSPRLHDDNDRRGVSSRLVVHVRPGLAVGVSAARGAFLSRALDPVLAAGETAGDFTQRAGGVDLEWASGRWQWRGEVLASRWRLPTMVSGPAATDVTAIAGWSEGRVRLLPGLDVGLRVERLAFSDIPSATASVPWEAGVDRFEAGVAYVPRRHVRLKLAAQRARRPDGGRVRHDTLVAAQVGVWF